MALLAAVILFVAFLATSILERGDRANRTAAIRDRSDLWCNFISPHRFDEWLNKCKPKEVRDDYFNIINAYVTLFVETPRMSNDWHVFNKRKCEFKYNAKIGTLSGFERHGILSPCETNHFSRVPQERHASVQTVSNILGYDIRNVPQDQFWKVVSDYEERFWFWSELDVQINHPTVVDYVLYDLPTIAKGSCVIEMKIPVVELGIVNALREKDTWSKFVWDRVEPFFNDQREKEIADAFINGDSEKLKSLSDEIGFDVSDKGRRMTILAFARTEGWFAHKYINPALSYQEYGYLLFGRNLDYYNAWREVFGAHKIPSNEIGELIRASDKLLKRYDAYKATKDAEDARLAAIKPPEFLPYKEAK